MKFLNKIFITSNPEELNKKYADKFKYIQYDDEFDMLYAFFYKMIPKMPILTACIVYNCAI